MLFMFELFHNVAEITKIICRVNGIGAINHSTVSRRFKKFPLSYKNLDYTTAGRPKTMNSKAVLQAIEANPVSSTQRV